MVRYGDRRYFISKTLYIEWILSKLIAPTRALLRWSISRDVQYMKSKQCARAIVVTNLGVNADVPIILGALKTTMRSSRRQDDYISSIDVDLKTSIFIALSAA